MFTKNVVVKYGSTLMCHCSLNIVQHLCLQNECDIGIQKHACLDVFCIMQYKGPIIILDIRMNYLL